MDLADQGETPLLLSLIWHQCFIGNSELMTCAYNLHSHLYQRPPAIFFVSLPLTLRHHAFSGAAGVKSV